MRVKIIYSLPGLSTFIPKYRVISGYENVIVTFLHVESFLPLVLHPYDCVLYYKTI